MTNPARPFDAERARAIVEEHSGRPGAMLPILHALQEVFGYVDRAAEPLIAEVLNVTRAEVHGVVTFYHDFRHTPPGHHTLRFCRAEACQSVGSEALAARAEAALGVATGETTSDGKVSLGAVYCLGLCAVAPSAMLDGRVFGRLNDARVDALVAEARR